MNVSVIIPAYNAERHLEQALASCLRQSDPPHEIVVADDGSTDRTFAIAQKFSPQVKAIRLERNMGVSEARNRAIAASTGDWLAFLDADDWFLPRKLERQRQCILENPQAVLVYTKYRVFSLDGVERDGLWALPDELSWRLRYQCVIHLSSAMLRRDAFEACGGFDPVLRNAQDWDLWLRVAARYTPGAFAGVPEHLVVYRRVAGSLSLKPSAIRHLKVRSAIIDQRSLYGVAGLKKFFLRRRIHAFHTFDTAVAAREQGCSEDLASIRKSLLLWPFPGRMLPLLRYKTAVVMLMQHLGWRSNPFRPDTRSRDGAPQNKG